MDMGDTFNVPPPSNGTLPTYNVPTGNVEVKQDLFSLLYFPETKQTRAVVPPSRWATFECKPTISVGINVHCFHRFHYFLLDHSENVLALIKIYASVFVRDIFGV